MNKFSMRFLLAVLCITTCLLVVACTNEQPTSATPENNRIKITKAVDGKVEGPATLIGKIDVDSSPYFKAPDFYHGNISDSLILLKNFKTYQQTSERSCGAACAVMVLNHFSVTDISEDALDKALDIRYYDNVRADGSYGASTSSLVKFFKEKDFKVESSLTAPSSGYSFETDSAFSDYVKKQLKNNTPIMTENVEWGGHWMVIIGYDDMGTKALSDDVLVFADPYDTSDQCQDGYYVRSFQRYFYEWFDANVMSKNERIQQFVTVKK